MFKMMIYVQASLITTTFLCSVLTQPVYADDKASEGVVLRYEFTAGDTISYVITSQSRMEALKDEFKQTTTSKSDTYRDLKINKVTPDGCAEVEVIMRHVRMESQFDQREPQIYDSSDAKTFHKEYDHIQKTIDQPFAKLLIAPTGKLKNVLAVNGTKEEEVNADPGMNFLVTFPEEPVTVGYTWKESLTQEMQVSKALKLNLNILRTFKVTKLENNIATIQFKTAILTPIRDPAHEVRTIQLEPAGEMMFDINRGVMISRTSRTNKTVINFTGPGTSLISNTIKTDTLTNQPPPTKKVAINPDNQGFIR